LRHLGRKWRAIVISSLFFGITHAVFQQSIVAFMVGLVIGYIAVQTGSLLPGMLYHVTHNSLMVLTLAITAESFQQYPALGYLLRKVPDGEGYIASIPVALVAAVIVAAILYWFRKLPYAKTPEESLQDAIQHHVSRAPSA
jgi:sodium transport system permease protein